MTPVKVHMLPENDSKKMTKNIYSKMKSSFTSLLSVISTNRSKKQNHNVDASSSTTTITTGWPHYDIPQSHTSYVGESRQHNGWDTLASRVRSLTWADNIVEIPGLESDDED